MKRYPVIIPARAGSKGIKDKNLIEICGKPLISWSIKQALESTSVSNVYVSTDGQNIAEVAEEYGANIILRPKELASDTASSEDVILHGIQEIDKREKFDSLIFLQATSPVRKKKDIDGAISEFENGSFDSLFSMAVLDDYCLWKRSDGKLDSYSYDYRNRGRRQEREPLYLENGSIYVFRKDLFLCERNRLGGHIGMYEMSFECSFEIDTLKDVEICEYYLRKIEEGIAKGE